MHPFKKVSQELLPTATSQLISNAYTNPYSILKREKKASMLYLLALSSI